MATVGGRPFDEDGSGVRRKMEGVQPEDIREHYTEVNGARYPPKQVLAVMTGWERTSYTTMEAQRVLAKIGFKSHRVGEQVRTTPPSEAPVAAPVDRTAQLDSAVAVLQEAVASLTARVGRLERRG
jgi:ubiquinone biosynthesis protein UbiJ